MPHFSLHFCVRTHQPTNPGPCIRIEYGERYDIFTLHFFENNRHLASVYLPPHHEIPVGPLFFYRFEREERGVLLYRLILIGPETDLGVFPLGPMQLGQYAIAESDLAENDPSDFEYVTAARTFYVDTMTEREEMHDRQVNEHLENMDLLDLTDPGNGTNDAPPCYDVVGPYLPTYPEATGMIPYSNHYLLDARNHGRFGPSFPPSYESLYPELPLDDEDFDDSLVFQDVLSLIDRENNLIDAGLLDPDFQSGDEMEVDDDDMPPLEWMVLGNRSTSPEFDVQMCEVEAVVPNAAYDKYQAVYEQILQVEKTLRSFGPIFNSENNPKLRPKALEADTARINGMSHFNEMKRLVNELKMIGKSNSLPKETVVPNMNATGTSAGSKGGSPVMPFVAHEKGNTGGGVPAHGDAPASSTVAGPITMPIDPQVRASRDIPAQAPLMAMVGGPPDMSQMNMYQDDILNLVYRQFHVGQTTIQGSQALGEVCFRLPYGLNLLSVYAQNWARLHKRYNGRIRVTFSTSGVPMLRGNILIGVVRNMPADNVTRMTPQSLQKINWTVLNLQGAGEYSVDIGDARQTKFFRNVDEDPVSGPPTDLTDRPGIVGIVYTPIVNQFGADSDNSVVINFRSAAISPIEDPVYGFKCWEPVDESVSTRSLDDSVPSMVYVKDILPTTANRSLYIDGAKVRSVDSDNPDEIETSRGPFTGVVRPATDQTTQRSEPFWFSADNRKFMICYPEMPTRYFKWGPNAFPVITGDSYPHLSDIGNGTIVETPVDNPFLGSHGGVERIKISNLQVVGSVNGSTQRDTTDVTVTQIVYANYAKGRLLFVFGEIPDGVIDGAIQKVQPVGETPGLESIIWQIGSDSPTTTNSLPRGYYNVTTALDGQIEFLATLGPLPVLYPQLAFTQAFLALRDRIVGPRESLTVDLIDVRNGDTVGYLFSLDNQVVIRTPVPNNASSHYRFNVDLEYLGLANARRTLGQPESSSAKFLTPLDLTRSQGKYELFKMLKELDAESMSKLMSLSLLEREEVVPNAAMAGMAAAAGIAGAASGVVNWLTAKQNLKNQMQLQEDFITSKFKANWNLQQQQFLNKLNIMGAQNFMNQPGAMNRNFSSQSKANTPAPYGPDESYEVNISEIPPPIPQGGRQEHANLRGIQASPEEPSPSVLNNPSPTMPSSEEFEMWGGGEPGESWGQEMDRLETRT